MKIIYATATDGIDRVTRCWEVLRHLREKGHELFVVGSGRSFSAVQEEFPESFRIMTPPRYLEGEERENYLWDKNRVLLSRIEHFRPDLMLLDGESFTGRLARRFRTPVISIDPQQLFTVGRLEFPVPPQHMDALLKLKESLRDRTIQATRYLLPLFHSAKLNQPNAQLCPPIIRSEVNNVTAQEGETFLAYGWPGIEDELFYFQEVEQPIEVHLPVRRHRQEQERVLWENEVPGKGGALRRRRKEKLPRELEQDEVQALLPPSKHGITFHAADSDLWLEHLASSKAVMLDGELTSIAEAIYFRKPMLVIPRSNRFDQWAYALYIEKMGFGEHHPRLTRAVLEGFLQRRDRYHQQLCQHKQTTNADFFEILEKAIQEEAKPPIRRDDDRRRGPHDSDRRRGPRDDDRRRGPRDGDRRNSSRDDDRRRGPRDGDRRRDNRDGDRRRDSRDGDRRGSGRDSEARGDRRRDSRDGERRSPSSRATPRRRGPRRSDAPTEAFRKDDPTEAPRTPPPAAKPDGSDES